MRLIIKNNLCSGIPKHYLPIRFISTRKLSVREVKLLRKQEIKRFYLSRLGPQDARKFFEEFDQFWDKTVAGFGREHCFWRNVVSSKMQEWEHSVCYFALILFTLSRSSQDKEERLLMITSSLEETQLLREWAKAQNWLILNNEGNVLNGINRMVQEITNSLKFFYYVFTVFYRKLFFLGSHQLTESKINNSVLIASLSYPSSFKGNEYHDPFFGNLHRFFSQYHKKCFYLSDLLGSPNSSIVKTMSHMNETMVFSPYSIVSFMELTKVLCKASLAKLKFPSSRFMGCDFAKLLTWNSRRFMYHYNIHAQVCFVAVKRLCQKYSFSQLLCVFEGNVFERACIQAFRKYSGARIDGYSHAPLYEFNLKLRLTENEKLHKPEPDRFICPGPYAKKMLSQIGNRPAAKLYSACTLKDVPCISLEQWKEQESDTLLIGLDGFFTSSCLLDWLIEHKDCLKGFKVLIREHPNLSLDKLLKQCVHSLPSFFEISRNSSLEEDIKKCFCVLYRHTSVGLQALLNGIPVIHLAIDTPLSADPMEELKEGKWTVRDSQALHVALNEIKHLDSGFRFKVQEEARNFAKDFFSIPTEGKLREFVEV